MTDCYHQSLLHFRVQNTQCRFYEARILEVLSCGSRKYLEIQFDGNISKVKRLNKNFLRLSFGIMIDIVMGNVCCQYSHDWGKM